MRLRPIPQRLRPRRRPPLKTIQVLPTVVTVGNLIAGVLAVTFLLEAAGAEELVRRERLQATAAWMIFFGMFCDGLDGRIARMTKTSSAFGAQLDSLADVVTFGVAPALLAKSLLATGSPTVGHRVLVALVMIYAVGAALRLARHNVESARAHVDRPERVTVTFRGLPSPAAAGVIASLVLLHLEFHPPVIAWALLVTTPALGLLMLSRLPYAHLLNRYLEGQRPLHHIVLPIAVIVFLCIACFLETVTAAFFLYAISGLLVYAVARLTGRLEWVFREEEDEADVVEDEIEREHRVGERGHA